MKTDRLSEILRDLTENYGAIGVKAEFEAEGARFSDVEILSEIVSREKSRLFVKIGGAEAVTDLFAAKDLAASGIIVPMVESPFALEKFRGAALRVYGEDPSVSFTANIESVSGVKQADAILKNARGLLSCVTVGRVDLAASYGLSRADIENGKMNRAAGKVIALAKKYGLTAGIGGGITEKTPEVVRRFGGAVDQVETRKIVLPAFGIDLKKALLIATQFEEAWLSALLETHGLDAYDENRLQLLKKRIGELVL